MGFYIRKSLSVGPLRFNLSKSGIGVSTGIPGLRIGTGPRGTYVHMGLGGLYYRQSLVSGKWKSGGHDSDRTHSHQGHSQDYSATHGPMEEIRSGCVTKMIDSDSAAFLAELEQKRKRMLYWPIGIVVLLVAGLALLVGQVSLWITIPCITSLTFTTFALYQFDQVKKCAVLMYDLDEKCLDSYEVLFESIYTIAKCGGAWHLTSQGNVHDSRYHAGAGKLVNRKRLTVGNFNPPYVKTNLSVPVLPFGKNKLYFLPDRVLVYAPNGIGAIAYQDMRITSRTTRFIESDDVPGDAKVVDHTWRYVNKNGSPDKRFKDNRQLPICEYEEIELVSSQGLKEVIQISRLGIAEKLKSAVASVVDAIRVAEQAEENRKREEQLEIEQQQLAASQKPSPQSAVKQKVVGSTQPTANMLHAALFDILCCMMAVDGNASKEEKTAIFTVMTKLKTNWTANDCEGRLLELIARMQSQGYAKVREESLNALGIFKQVGRKEVLLKCVDYVMSVRQQPNEQERALRDQIRKLMK